MLKVERLTKRFGALADARRSIQRLQLSARVLAAKRF